MCWCRCLTIFAFSFAFSIFNLKRHAMLYTDKLQIENTIVINPFILQCQYYSVFRLGWDKVGVGILVVDRRDHDDDVIKWKHFLCYWPFVRGIHRSPVDYSHQGQWHGALMFSLFCAWTNGWAINRDAGDLRRYRARFVTTVKIMTYGKRQKNFNSGFNPFPQTSNIFCVMSLKGLVSGIDRPIMLRSKTMFMVILNLRLNKWVSKQSRRWWFETLSRSLCHHCKDNDLWKAAEKF